MWNTDLSDTYLDLLFPDTYTNIPSKYFVCLHKIFKTSLRHVFKIYSRHVFKTSLRNVFKMSWRHVFKTSSRHVFQDVLKTPWKRLQDVLQGAFNTSWRRLQDVLEDVKLLRWRRVEDVFKTNKCLLGRDSVCKFLTGFPLMAIDVFWFCKLWKCLSVCLMSTKSESGLMWYSFLFRSSFCDRNDSFE